MKFFSFSSLAFSALAVSSAYAQGIRIGAPVDGATVSAGSTLVVDIDRPNTLTPSTEIAIVIGLSSCASSTGCPAPEDSMGTALYNGPFDPQYQDDGASPNYPHQNFTVTIPANTEKGQAQLNVAHFALVGAVQYVLTQTRNVSLTVV
ncbi:hypothetical protein HMN09_00835200 [Mycena chlorophos]|uniref:Phosphatidylglycerol/phosphatidylinositol transfer protein n=1 Tax=Mycena chlorophos TaxID=658473 RepID=A0A8H6W3J4_MYCCL|nr:hypothetical protein HMN09_00835200 [Mycena chlorophos]